MNYLEEWLNLTDRIKESKNIDTIIINGNKHVFSQFKQRVYEEVTILLKNKQFLNKDTEIVTQLLKIKNQIEK